MDVPPSADDLANTIVYLRPCGHQAVAALDYKDNKRYVRPVAPPPKPTDKRPEGFSRSSVAEHGSNGKLREGTDGPSDDRRPVFRLGFDSIQKRLVAGFVFGSSANSDIHIPSNQLFEKEDAFRIHYNFESGALLVTAIQELKVGNTRLKNTDSLVLLPNNDIEYRGPEDRYIVEFPDTNQCAEQHKRNYREYVERLGFPNTPYMTTSNNETLAFIGFNYRSKGLLGTGAYGSVQKAVHIETGAAVAIKELHGEQDKSQRNQWKEVEIMQRLSHPNIIRFDDAFELQDRICIVMELAASDLRKHLAANRFGKELAADDVAKGTTAEESAQSQYLPLHCVQSISRQTLLAVEYLHANGVMHRDLKPANILVTNWHPSTLVPTIKLTDFGLSGLNPEHYSNAGTRGYIAPEMERAYVRNRQIERERRAGMSSGAPLVYYTKAVDIWALGKILQELLDMIDPTPGEHIRERIPPHALGAVLFRKMMRDKPEQRPTASECLKDPWSALPIIASIPPTKRSRSPQPSSSSAQPHKKVLQDIAGCSYSDPDRSLSGDDFALSIGKGHASSSKSRQRKNL